MLFVCNKNWAEGVKEGKAGGTAVRCWSVAVSWGKRRLLPIFPSHLAAQSEDRSSAAGGRTLRFSAQAGPSPSAIRGTPVSRVVSSSVFFSVVYSDTWRSHKLEELTDDSVCLCPGCLRCNEAEVSGMVTVPTEFAGLLGRHVGGQVRWRSAHITGCSESYPGWGRSYVIGKFGEEMGHDFEEEVFKIREKVISLVVSG